MKCSLQFVMFLLASLLLIGCAMITPQQQALINETIPVCIGQRDCELKWAAARRWVINNAHFKIQIYSDDLIETYNPPANSIELAARIIKEPLANGDYAIVPYVWCNNFLACSPTLADALIGFNNYVNSVKAEDGIIYKELLKKDNYSKPRIGIQFKSMDDITIRSVFSESPASKAGLKSLDVILSINGKRVPDIRAFSTALEGIDFGDRAPIEVNRNGETYNTPQNLDS